MQAITTKYLCATNSRGSRIKASCERGSVTVSYPYEFSGDKAHFQAVQELVGRFVKEDAAKYGTHRNPWACNWIPGGQDKTGNVVWVSANDTQFTPVV